MLGTVDEPSSVTLWLPELRPYGVRFDFRSVEDEAGHRHELKVGHAWVEPPGDERELVPPPDSTLAENLYKYELIARQHLEGRVERAMRIERQMQDESRLRQYEPHTTEHLVRYVGDYWALGGPKRGTMRRLADLWGVTPRQARRRLERADAEGHLPEGLPRRR